MGNRYRSAESAREAYDAALGESKRIFGKNRALQGLVRTVARFVFTGKYPSVPAAKAGLDSLIHEAQSVFDEPDLVRIAAFQVFRGKFRSIAAAKSAFDAALADSEALFRSDPFRAKFVRAVAFALFRKKFAGPAEAQRALEKAISAARQFLGQGEEIEPVVVAVALTLFHRPSRSAGEVAHEEYDRLLLLRKKSEFQRSLPEDPGNRISKDAESSPAPGTRQFGLRFF